MTESDFTTHSKKCLAEAIISAVQNFRDDEKITSTEFQKLFADSWSVLEVAKSYLRDELQTCTCHVGALNRVKRVYAQSGTAYAQSLAEAELQNGTITPVDYIYLVKWTEDRA